GAATLIVTSLCTPSAEGTSSAVRVGAPPRNQAYPTTATATRTMTKARFRRRWVGVESRLGKAEVPRRAGMKAGLNYTAPKVGARPSVPPASGKIYGPGAVAKW